MIKMVKKHAYGSCRTRANQEMGCCKVESIVTVDERGQMVLPKEVRDKARIRAGDKLAVIRWEQGDKLCGVFLMKVEYLADMVRGMLGPMMKEVVQ